MKNETKNTWQNEKSTNILWPHETQFWTTFLEIVINDSLTLDNSNFLFHNWCMLNIKSCV